MVKISLIQYTWICLRGLAKLNMELNLVKRLNQIENEPGFGLRGLTKLKINLDLVKRLNQFENTLGF